jgi:DNA polymerase type B, organellar and viral
MRAIGMKRWREVTDSMLDFDTITAYAPLTGAERFRRHYNSGRYKRPKSSHATPLLDKPICAIDGEGADDANHVHHYREFRAVWPTGRAEITADSLTTQQCLDFIFKLPADHVIVIYGGSYDTNMWVRFLPHHVIDGLLDGKTMHACGYKIRWVERKYLTIRRKGQSRVVYDVLANFQRTFVATCKAWEIGTPEQLDFVAHMKNQRDHLGDIAPETVAEYNWLECELLAQLCRRFFDAIKETGYRPRAVYGPGALAVAALEQHGVKAFMKTFPELNDIPLRAYYGGRFDVSMLGEFSNVWQYDIKSAYPDQIRDLPCLAHATWEKSTVVQRYGVYHVDWETEIQTVWPPFPHRTPRGIVHYSADGAGWYYGDEVMAAIELYGPERIYVTDGYALVQHCSHQPFRFVEALYALRQTMPYEKGVVIKLILNSLYGKTAQQVGGRKGKPPPFQNFIYAGLITSGTRAKILRGLAQSPTEVIGIATDSLVALREFDLDVGDMLGQWEVTHLTRYRQIGNGVYQATGVDGKPVERSRGFERSTLDWDACMAHYRRTRGSGIFTFTTRARFITHREARQHGDARADLACRWFVEDRKLNFSPPRRWPEAWDHKRGQMRCTPYRIMDLMPPDRVRESSPFRLKTTWTEVHDMRVRYFPVAATE